MVNGPGDVLELVRRGRAQTRGDVIGATGLSRLTVAQRVDALLAARLLVEGETTGPTGGRRSRSLVFNGRHSLVAVAAVDTTHAQLAVTDLDGTVLAEDSLLVEIADGPVAVLDTLAASLARLLERHGASPADLTGVGLSLPGPIDPVSGRPNQPPIMPGWDGFPVADRLSAALDDVVVHTANDADAAALGEFAAGHEGARALCLVKVSTGIGAGIVLDGRSYTGADGGAGDIGHVKLDPGSPLVCRCGAHGCLAALASGAAVARQLADLGRPVTHGLEVGDLLRAGDPDAGRLTQQAGRRIGEVLAGLVCVLNPEVLLVGGALASTPLLTGIRETLYRLCLPRATTHLTLQIGALGHRAAVVGLTRLVVDRELSAEAVNRRLAQSGSRSTTQ